MISPDSRPPIGVEDKLRGSDQNGPVIFYEFIILYGLVKSQKDRDLERF